MKRTRFFLIPILIFYLVTNLFFAGCGGKNQPAFKVVTGTTLISAIVAEVGGERASVASIIPPAEWPEDFEVKPEALKVLSDADLFLIHDWQNEKFTQEIIAQVGNRHLAVEKISLGGDWMIPSVQSAATDKVAEALMRVDSKNKTIYQKAAAGYKKRISEKETQIRNRTALAYKDFISRNIPSFNVICAEPLRDFIQWLGVKVVATYGRPDSITPQVVAELAALGKEKKIVLVVDSFQSGKTAGAEIARSTGALRVILSNYPGGFNNSETWEKTIDRNTGLILGALDEC